MAARNRRTPSFCASPKPTGCSKGSICRCWGDDLQPDRLVTAEDLARWPGLPAFYGDDMLLPSGKTPAYLGQARAILIYTTSPDSTLPNWKFREETIKFGAVTGPLEAIPGAASRYVRVRAINRSTTIALQPEGHANLPGIDEKHLPVWPEGREGDKLDQEGMRYGGQIADEMHNPPADWLVMSRRYTTHRSIPRRWSRTTPTAGSTRRRKPASGGADPVAAGSGRRDAAHAGQAQPPVKQLILHPCYTVGYGSKDHHNFPYYGAVAAMYGDGHPVRLANDRFEQFQTALKRHAFDMNYRIAVNRQTGVMQSFLGDMTADGGGRSNFTLRW